MEVRSSLIKPMRNGKRAHEIRAPTTRPDNIHSIPGAYRVKERNSYRLCSEHTSNEHTQNLVKIKKKTHKACLRHNQLSADSSFPIPGKGKVLAHKERTTG